MNVLRETTEIATLSGNEGVPMREVGKGESQWQETRMYRVKCPELSPHGGIANGILTAVSPPVATRDLHRMLWAIKFTMDKALNFKAILKGLIFSSPSRHWRKKW